MDMTTTEIEAFLAILARTPPFIASISNSIEKDLLQYKSEEEPWSANDILAHLRACAVMWGKSILAMLEKDQPTLRYVSPRTWIRKTDYPEQDFHHSLEAFSQQRNELLNTLKSLKTEDWSRGATFTGTTKGRNQTVLSYVRRLALHENEHCAQIEALMKNMR
jgi:hypothetical protein